MSALCIANTPNGNELLNVHSVHNLTRYLSLSSNYSGVILRKLPHFITIQTCLSSSAEMQLSRNFALITIAGNRRKFLHKIGLRRESVPLPFGVRSSTFKETELDSLATFLVATVGLYEKKVREMRKILLFVLYKIVLLCLNNTFSRMH